MIKNKKGFTLIELVIVIAVIAILLTVLVPIFSSIVEKAKNINAVQYARNQYTQYFSEYGGKNDFIDDVIIKYKESNCIIFINGQMQDNIYTLEEAIIKAKELLFNYNLNIKANNKYVDILMLTEKTNNSNNEESFIGISPIVSTDVLTNGNKIVIIYQAHEVIPDFTYLGVYNETKFSFDETKNINEALILTIEKDGKYYRFKTEKDQYLYVNIENKEHDNKIYLGPYNDEHKDVFLWNVSIVEGEVLIYSKLTHNNGYHYYLTYYYEDKEFTCHFEKKYSIRLYQPLYFIVYI